MEWLAYKNCDIGLVTSNQDKKYIEDTYKVKNKIKVIQNYVDTRKFNIKKKKKLFKIMLIQENLT